MEDLEKKGVPVWKIALKADGKTSELSQNFDVLCDRPSS